MGEKLSAEHLQEIAAMNARTYAMTEEDRERWYAEHPVSMFEGPVDHVASSEHIRQLDTELRFTLGGHVAALSIDELKALVQLRETIGKVLEEAGLG